MTVEPSNAAISEAPKPADTRDHSRVPFAGRVVCVSKGQYELAGLDISGSGIGLLSPRPFKHGQRVTLLFCGGTRAIEGVVTAVRTVLTSDWQIGVSFVERQPSLLDEIRAA